MGDKSLFPDGMVSHGLSPITQNMTMNAWGRNEGVAVNCDFDAATMGEKQDPFMLDSPALMADAKMVKASPRFFQLAQGRSRLPSSIDEVVDDSCLPLTSAQFFELSP